MTFKSVQETALAQEILGLLIAKFEKMPRKDRELMAVATTEAAACIAAMETVSHIRRQGGNAQDAEERLSHYDEAFVAYAKHVFNKRRGDL